MDATDLYPTVVLGFIKTKALLSLLRQTGPFCIVLVNRVFKVFGLFSFSSVLLHYSEATFCQH